MLAGKRAAAQLPPLETLAVTAFADDGWPEVKEVCRDGLNSLKITSSDSRKWTNSRIVKLLKLCHLEVCDKEGNQCSWARSFITPILKNYMETTWDQSSPADPREALKSITHSRFSRPPSLSVTNKLQILQLSLPLKQIYLFLDDLKAHDIVFPQLELLEFSGSFMRHWDIPIAKVQGCTVLMAPELTVS
jgi:hypothetical protein